MKKDKAQAQKKIRKKKKTEGGEKWVVYELPKERSAVAGRHSLICYYSHQASGTTTLALCMRVCVFARAASLIGILVAGWGKAESPWRPGTKEESGGDRKLRNKKTSNHRRGREEGVEENKGKTGEEFEG